MDPKSPNPEADTEKRLPEGQWSTGFYDCCDDPSNCFLTCVCPCITFGRVAEVIDRGNLSCKIQGLIYHAMCRIGCGWVYGGIYRSKLRRNYSLPEAPCSDWLVHGCCCVCALTQEYRELKNRGVDPSIGWKGNVEKWNGKGLKPPFVAPDMAR